MARGSILPFDQLLGLRKMPIVTYNLVRTHISGCLQYDYSYDISRMFNVVTV
jgi:hypothetical protein